MLMRRRLYFLLPDMPSAHGMLDEMLLARIEVRHIRFLARRGTLDGDLPEAGMMQKTDFVHGAQTGIMVGGLCGTLGGALLVFFPPEGLEMQLVTVLITALLGAVFGSWASSLAASSIPNSRLNAFHAEIERGKVLMMVDVPLRRVTDISDLVARRHPEAVPGGVEPTIPAFP
jgi:hypothetical protein